MTNQDQLQRELNELVRKLDSLVELLKKDKQKLLMPGAKIVQEAIHQNAPIGTETHYRYSTPKLSKKIRAPKGKGVKVATYHPSNLAWSINTMKFGSSKALFVGPKVKKGPPGGEFGGSSNKSDGYYAHMVEFGTSKMAARPFVRPAVDGVIESALQANVQSFKDAVNQFAAQNAV